MTERYTLAYSVNRDRWYIYRRGTDEIVAGPFKSRDAAIKRLDRLEVAS